jgi:hypothetical protein
LTGQLIPFGFTGQSAFVTERQRLVTRRLEAVITAARWVLLAREVWLREFD